jgi:hypothetical protein
VLTGELANQLRLLGGLDVLVRGKVVGDYRDLRFIEEVLHPILLNSCMATGVVTSLPRTKSSLASMS